MGEHRRNPRAIAAAQPRQLPPGTEAYGFELQAVVELNKVKLAEMVKLVDAAKAAGQDPRFAVPRWNTTENPDFFDYVVYNVAHLARTSSLVIDQRQIPVARIRWSEHLRIPLVELRSRADAAFAGKEAEGEASH